MCTLSNQKPLLGLLTVRDGNKKKERLALNWLEQDGEKDATPIQVQGDYVIKCVLTSPGLLRLLNYERWSWIITGILVYKLREIILVAVRFMKMF